MGGENKKKKEAGKHGTVFLGNPVNLKRDGYVGEGGTIDYDPDFECTGGSTDPADKHCPYQLRTDDAMGLGLSGWDGRLLHMNMPSYRDPLCPRTLKNLFTKAKRPFDIRVRVLQQNAPEEGDPPCLEKYCEMMADLRRETGGGDTSKGGPEGDDCPHRDQVYIHPIHAKEAAGPTYARGLLGQDIVAAYEKEEISPQDFCMSTDSHMDFEPHWDERMVEMWDLAQNEYAVLSTYVANIDQLGVNLGGQHEVPHLCMVTFTSQVRTHATKCARNLPKPKLTNAIWGAGLSFSKCHAELKVPVDPHTPGIFDGEEFNRAARFWTYGYDIYTPHRVYVLHDYPGSQVRVSMNDYLLVFFARSLNSLTFHLRGSAQSQDHGLGARQVRTGGAQERVLQTEHDTGRARGGDGCREGPAAEAVQVRFGRSQVPRRPYPVQRHRPPSQEGDDRRKE